MTKTELEDIGLQVDFDKFVHWQHGVYDHGKPKTKRANGYTKLVAELDKQRDVAIGSVWLLNVGDIITTTIALHNGAHESNPLMTGIAGNVGALIFAKLFVLLFITFIARKAPARRGAALATFVAGVYTIVVLSNLFVIFR